jgi:hypothetical protein
MLKFFIIAFVLEIIHPSYNLTNYNIVQSYSNIANIHLKI